MRSILQVPGRRIFSYGFFYCLDCFARLMKDDSEVPLSQANRRMPSSFCFCFFQAGSLQMHPEGHSRVPKIVVGNQSHPGHRITEDNLMNGRIWGRTEGNLSCPRIVSAVKVI